MEQAFLGLMTGLYIGLVGLVGNAADKKGHSFWLWCVVAWILTPVVGGLIVLCLEKKVDFISGEEGERKSNGSEATDEGRKTDLMNGICCPDQKDDGNSPYWEK